MIVCPRTLAMTRRQATSVFLATLTALGILRVAKGSITVGVILPKTERDLAHAVDLATSQMMATNMSSTEHVLVRKHYLTDWHDTPGTLEAVMRAIQSGSDMLVVASSPYTSDSVAALLQTQIGVPTIMSGPHLPLDLTSDAADEMQDNTSVIYHPAEPSIDFPIVLSDLLSNYNWISLGIVVDENIAFPYSIPKLLSAALDRKWSVAAIEYVSASTSDFELLQKLGSIKLKGVRIIYIDAFPSTAKKIFEVAVTLRMMYGGWAWIVSDNVAHGGGLFQPCFGAPEHMWGILGIRKKLAFSSKASMFIKDWESEAEMMCPCSKLGPDLRPLMLYDSIQLAYRAAISCIEEDCSLPMPVAVDTCANFSDSPARDNSPLMGLLFTERDSFNESLIPVSRPEDASTYEIVNMYNGQWKVIGEWQESNSSLTIHSAEVLFTGRTREVPKDTSGDVSGQFFKVSTVLDDPFVRLKKNASGHEQVGEYEGICIDLLEELSRNMGFEYSLRLADDGQYGVWDATSKSWNGLMGELIGREATLAVAAMSISYDREQYVSFTKPYMDYGTTILMPIGEKQSSVFAFLQPFSADLWFAVGGTIATCAISICILSYFSPYGNAKARQSKMSFAGSFWFVWASLMDQGSEPVPRCFSARIVTGIFWFTTFILSASYTANLTAFLTVTRLASDIKSVEDLAGQTEIEYGVPSGTQISMFFENAKMEPYIRMNDFMSTGNRMAATPLSGIKRVQQSVRSGKHYALLYDNHMLDYAAKNVPCVTYTVGRLFNKGGYGLALRKGSPYTAAFTLELLHMRQKGFIEELQHKWIHGPCLGDGHQNQAAGGEQLTLDAMVGVFYVFGFSIILAIVAILFECLINKCREEPYPGEQPSLLYKMGAPFRQCTQLLSSICRGNDRQKGHLTNTTTGTSPSFQNTHMSSHQSTEGNASRIEGAAEDGKEEMAKAYTFLQA